MADLCRDCFRLDEAGTGERRCPHCGSRRLVAHPELAGLAIAHIDCDAFYASVEKRDRPELRDRPVIVGGGRRGVVSAACYVARIHGVRSAMPMFKALEACPDAVVIRPDMARYAAVGRQIREMMQALTPAVEPLSVDEAFLDMRGTERLHHAPPAVSLARLTRRIEEEVGVTASVGLSYNKFLAKVASDLDKPRGFAVIGRGDARAFLAAQPVTLIWGVGRALAARLARDGITRIAQLQTMEEAGLVARYGSIGSRLYRFARGEDERTISAERETRSISSETTFEDDIATPDELRRRLWPLCEKTAHRAKQAGLAGRTVVLKLKTASFRTVTRNSRLPAPGNLAETLYRAALPLLDAAATGTAFRLIGIGLADLSPAADAAPAADLFAGESARDARVEEAIDAVRARLGDGAIGRGRGFRPAPKRSRT